MPAKLEEIEGTFAGERFRKGEFVIATIHTSNQMLTIKGEADADELEYQARYRFYGRFTKYKNPRSGAEERQFTFQTFVPARAHDREGVIEYLKRAGKGLGLGQRTAEKLWDQMGSDAVREIREYPEQLKAYRIKPDAWDAIAARLNAWAATEDATIEVTNLLAGRGFPKKTSRYAIKKWGNRAAAKIKRDPYSLIAMPGCGFKRCDALWIELGNPPDAIRRQALCVWHSLTSNSDGHTWHPVELAHQAVRQSIGSTKATPQRAIEFGLRLGRLFPNHYAALSEALTEGVNGVLISGESPNQRRWIAEAKNAKSEERIAEMVADANDEGTFGFSLWPDARSITGVDNHQRSKLGEALVSRIAILGGSPGTGKTYATAMLIKALLRSDLVSMSDIAIGAPTGKAAVRMTEALAAAGVPIKARTWHSLLGFATNGDTGAFLHNETNPWPFRVIIGDEMSMADAGLMKSILAARGIGCHVLLVGDVNQLPPVGSGAPLRDMIASKTIGYGELTEIKRNSGGIVEACAAIRDGKAWLPGDNLIVIPSTKPTDQLDACLKTLQREAAKFDPVWDAQVLVAVNARSPLARKKVNEFLQTELNPNPKIAGTPFRKDDKIVCLKNGRYTAIEADDDAYNESEGGNEVYVANGELARVISIEEKMIVAQLANPKRVVRIPRGKSKAGEGDEASTGCFRDLAYALTCHKLQGSEAPIVIVLVDEYSGAKRICSREWIYTAFSRAKDRCYTIGRKSTVDSMTRLIAIGNRKTFLRERLQLEHATLTLESL